MGRPVGGSHRSDFRKLAEGFIKVLSKFAKVEKVEFDESVSSNFQDVTVSYVNPKTQEVSRVRFSTFADWLPQTIELSLSRLFEAAGLKWWRYRHEHSRKITIYSDTDLTIELEVPSWDWVDVDRPAKVKLLRNRKLIYEGEISVFDIFDFVVSAFTLTRL
jgi:hypothetical protein